VTSEAPSTNPAGDVFATTHWSVVLTAGQRVGPQAQAALEQLCRTYWFPVYAYVRRRGRGKEDAEDLSQEFFRRLLERNDFARLDSERGKFRAFLLASLKHFLANEWDKSQCQKRGGGLGTLSLDWKTADTQFQVAATNQTSPDQAYDREWAVALLSQVLEGLRVECEAEGKAAQFEHLRAFLTAEQRERTYAEAATALNMEETAVRVAVHRLRKRYRQLLRDEIANTLSDAGQVAEELQALFGAFRTS
jgi:RNA polymerase sigma factor (sigma-70 family)